MCPIANTCGSRLPGILGLSLIIFASGFSQDKPNILLILTDQHSEYAMSNAGNPHLNTPAMDEIAGNGIRFSRAYVTQPLCSPFRTSMLVGKYPHETGTTRNGEQADLSYKLIGKAMMEAGYEVVYHGKWHATYSGSENHDIFNAAKNDAGAADRVVDYLESSSTKPFFLTASFLNPHDICQWARDLGGIANQDLPQGPIADLPADNSNLPPLPANHMPSADEPPSIREVQEQFKGHHYPTQDYTEITWRQYLWGYYRMIEKVDVEIKKVLDALKNSGQLENTVVIFTSDHGEGMAAHRWNQKQVLYDETVRVPMLVSYKGKSPAGIVDSTHLVSNAMDFYPTLLDFAGVPIPDHYRGRSLKPLIMGETVTDWREYVVAETKFAMGGNYTGVSGRMLQTLDKKYVVYNRDGKVDGDQFFDLTTDPGEMVNLAVDDKYNYETNKFKNMLKDWQVQTEDTDFEVPDTTYVDPLTLTHGAGRLHDFTLKGLHNIWNFTVPFESVEQVRVFDIQGRVLFQTGAKMNSASIFDWKAPSNGLYFVSFYNGGAVTNRKIFF